MLVEPTFIFRWVRQLAQHPDQFSKQPVAVTSGINSIRLEHNQLVGTYYLRMVVNPRKLIDPRASYIGILPPEKSSVKKLKKAFSKLFQNTVFENSINAYQLPLKLPV